LRLDGIVTLVDSFRIKQQLAETLEASQQIAYADRILLNKSDLVESTEDVRATVRKINPAAQIRTTSYSQIPDLDWILDARCYNNKEKSQGVNEEVDQLVSEIHEHSQWHSHEHGHEHGHDHDCLQCRQSSENHTHTSAVSTICLFEHGTVVFEKINAWLASTLWPNQDEKDEVLRSRLEQQMQQDNLADDDDTSQQQHIFRMKGILSVKQNPAMIEEAEWQAFCDHETDIDKRQFIVQAVYDLWDIHPSSEQFVDSSEQQRSCKLIVIGRYLNREELERGFRACLV
jgi:G3E family GTPase